MSKAIGKIVSRGLGSMAPDWGHYLADGAGSSAGLIRVRRPHWPEGKAIEIPASGVEDDPGAQIDVRFHQRNRQLPFASRKSPSARGQLSSGGSGPFSYYAMWAQCEANPQCNRATRDQQSPPTWANEAGASVLATLPRYYYGDALHSDALPGSFNSLISHEGVVLGETTVAAMVSLYNADHSSIVGYLVREWDLVAETEISWLHILSSTIGTIPTNNAQRRQGYLFFDRSSNSYTVACPQGLLLCTAANAPTPTVCAWAHSYGTIPPESSVSVAGGYAMTGAMGEYDAVFGYPADCAVDIYYRTATEWVHLIQKALGDQLSGCDIVDSCGKWDPFLDVAYALPEVCNSRWPYLPSTGEFLVWITGKAGSIATLAKAKFLGIKASTGALRVIEEVAAPLELLQPYALLQDDLAAELTYRATHHTGNWEETGLFYDPLRDPGNASLGYDSTGYIYTRAQMNDFYGTPEDPGILYADWPSGDGQVYAQRVTRYSGWTGDRDPTVAPDSQKLSCGAGEGKFPRGIVDRANNKAYLFVDLLSWKSNETANTGPDAEEDYLYSGSYSDQEITHLSEAFNGPVRVFSFERSRAGGFSYDTTATRVILRQYSGSALLGTLDLTRPFTGTATSEQGNSRTYDYLQKPDIYEYAIAGDYLWVLAADWWAVDNQKLSLILINKTSLLELARVDLSPDEALERLWLIDRGRPQLWAGVDSTGEPRAQVAAWWSATGSDESVIQEIRYVDSALVKSIKCANTSADGTDQPSRLTAIANVAIEPGSQFWLDAGKDLKRLNS